jgi:multiple sugar transport system ATP-binding protein
MGKVVFRSVCKRYYGEKRNSVDKFDLEVQDGEFLVLVGPSGCGKSTLLRMLGGLEDITEGDIYINDRLVNYVSSKERNIAMVFQNYALYPHMNAYENIAFGLRLRKFPKHEIHERVSRASRILEISALLDKLPKNISGGQRQRVALGRAIVREPEVFLMDEPLSNLDAKLRVQMREEIGKLHKKLKTTTIYVTHDQIEAMTMGTRIVVMRDGVMQQVGTPAEIYKKPSNMFVAGFIGSPPMNFINGKLIRKAEQLYFDTKRYSLLIPKEKADVLQKYGYESKTVFLGVRAENVQYEKEILNEARFTEAQLDVSIEMMEFMGSDLYLLVNNGEHSLKMRMDPLKTRVEEGDNIRIGIDMNVACLFDSSTEEFIC